MTHICVLVSVFETQNTLPVVSDIRWRRKLWAVFPIWGENKENGILNKNRDVGGKKSTKTEHKSNNKRYIIHSLPHLAGVQVVEVEREGAAERGRVNRVPQVPLAVELGWSFSENEAAQHGKAPASPATGRSCGPGMGAARRWEGARCWNNSRSRHFYLTSYYIWSA